MPPISFPDILETSQPADTLRWAADRFVGAAMVVALTAMMTLTETRGEP